MFSGRNDTDGRFLQGDIGIFFLHKRHGIAKEVTPATMILFLISPFKYLFLTCQQRSEKKVPI